MGRWERFFGSMGDCSEKDLRDFLVSLPNVREVSNFLGGNLRAALSNGNPTTHRSGM